MSDPTISGDRRIADGLEDLEHAANTVAMLISAGAHAAADKLLGRLIETVDHELVKRGNAAPERALFEDLLLAAQRARELVPVPIHKEKERVVDR